MVSTLLAIAFAGQVIEAPRRLDRLDNGAVVFAERIPESDRISVQLWVSSRGTEESAENHGWRHLLEHFLAGRMDAEVESKGMFLMAETARSAMSFEIVAAPEQLAEALSALRGIWKPLSLTSDQIAREVRIIRHEEATLPASRLFARAAWARVYGDSSPDPFGDPSVMERATPTDLERLRVRMLASANIVVAVAGAVAPEAALSQARPWLASLPPSPPALSRPTPDPAPKIASVGAFGEALALAVNGMEERETLAALAVGLVAAQFYADLRLSYSVSAGAGVATLATTERDGLKKLEGLSDQQLHFGPLLVQRWLDGIGASPSRLASLRGALLVEGSSLTLETLRRGAERLSVEEIKAAQQSWLQAARLEGLR